MITEDYVSFEVAKLLKEKGFPLPSTSFKDWVCCMYDKNGDIQWGCYHPDWYARVTLQMAMKWLRDKKNIHIKVHCSGNRNYLVYVQSLVTAFHDFCIESATCSFNSYEEACEAAIKYCLTNLI